MSDGSNSDSDKDQAEPAPGAESVPRVPRPDTDTVRAGPEKSKSAAPRQRFGFSGLDKAGKLKASGRPAAPRPSVRSPLSGDEPPPAPQPMPGEDEDDSFYTEPTRIADPKKMPLSDSMDEAGELEFGPQTPRGAPAVAAPVAAQPQTFAAVKKPDVLDEPTRVGDRSYIELVKSSKAQLRRARGEAEERRERETTQESIEVKPEPTPLPPTVAPPARAAVAEPQRVGMVPALLGSLLGSAAGAAAVLLAVFWLASSFPGPIREVLGSSGDSATGPDEPGAPRPAARAAASAADVSALLARPADERTAAENILVARHRRQQHTALIGRLREHLAHEPGLARDPATLRHLSILLADSAIAIEAAETLAAMPGHAPMDVLYSYLMRQDTRDSTAALVEELLRSKDVLAKASPALRVAVGLRQPRKCEEYLALLPQAVEHADERALPLLEALKKPKRACGASGKADCHNCLRGAKALDEAIDRAKSTSAPRL